MGANFWPVLFCHGLLFSGFNGKCSWLPNPQTVQYCGSTHSNKSSRCCIFLVLKNMLEAMNVYKSLN